MTPAPSRTGIHPQYPTNPFMPPNRPASCVIVFLTGLVLLGPAEASSNATEANQQALAQLRPCGEPDRRYSFQGDSMRLEEMLDGLIRRICKYELRIEGEFGTGRYYQDGSLHRPKELMLRLAAEHGLLYEATSDNALTVVLPQVDQQRPSMPNPFAARGDPPVLTGVVLFDGQPITQFTEEWPQFSFWPTKEPRHISPSVDWKDGTYSVFGVPPDRYQMSMHFPDTGTSRVPDLFRFNHRDLLVGQEPTHLDLNVVRTLRLIEPADSREILDPGECAERSTFHGPIRFRWEAIGRGETYRYSVRRRNCGPGTVVVVSEGTTTADFIELPLPANAQGEIYEFSLTATKDGRDLGALGFLRQYGDKALPANELPFRIR